MRNEKRIIMHHANNKPIDFASLLYLSVFVIIYFILCFIYCRGVLLLPVARANHMLLFELLSCINYFAYALYLSTLKSWESAFGTIAYIDIPQRLRFSRLKLYYYFYYYKTCNLLAST